MDERDRMDLLDKLEAGEISAEQALQALAEGGEGVGEPEERQGAEQASTSWRGWWLIPFSLGIAGTAAGLGLSQLGGWWWVCAGPLLIFSLVVVIVSAATSQSPWIHVRIRTSGHDGSQRVNLHLPIPVRLTSWGLRLFGGSIPGLDRTAVDDLILGLEGSLSRDTPIYIEVDEGEDGERVEVFMG